VHEVVSDQLLLALSMVGAQFDLGFKRVAHSFSALPKSFLTTSVLLLLKRIRSDLHIASFGKL
jgi:hypothetical protein